MKNLLIIIIAAFISPELPAQESLYISPGVSVSLGGGNNITFGWKLSIGYVQSEEWYYNVTFGKSFSPSDREDNMFLEFQRGDFFGYYPLSAGAGAGVSFGGGKIYPRLTMFGGALLFANLHYTFGPQKFGFSGELSLPLPFNKELRDLGPG